MVDVWRVKFPVGYLDKPGLEQIWEFFYPCPFSHQARPVSALAKGRIRATVGKNIAVANRSGETRNM